MLTPRSEYTTPRWLREAYAGSSFLDEYLDRINRRENLDRFIPNRSATEFDFAKSVLTLRWSKPKGNTADVSPTRQAYRKKLAEACDMNRRIFAFKNKTPERINPFPQDLLSSPPMPKPKPSRHIPRKPERTLDAADMVDDFNLNLLDWASSNVLAIALGNTAYLWDASKDSVLELVTVDEEDGPITSINWAPDGRQIAIGLDNSHVQLWDSTATRKIRTFKTGHRQRVGSLAWNNHILTSGGMDGKIINRDVRMRSAAVETYVGHRKEVCGLKWSNSHQQLASGGDDNLVYIWDRSLASSSGGRRWLHKLVEHTAAVRALAWCPFESSLLTSGGGAGDQCIKFWNTHSGRCLSSIDTGSEVCSLQWNVNERELLSSHGFSRHQLTLWKYPSMEKMAELSGHSARVLHMAQSPDGCTVASAAGDGCLKFWNVFGTPGATKPKAKAYREPFPHVSRIR